MNQNITHYTPTRMSYIICRIICRKVASNKYVLYEDAVLHSKKDHGSQNWIELNKIWAYIIPFR